MIVFIVQGVSNWDQEGRSIDRFQGGLVELIDTHCHLDIERHFPDYKEVLERARSAAVHHMVLAGVTRKGWPRMVELSSQHPELHAAPGMHPMYLQHHSTIDLDELTRLTVQQPIVAIGEIGLDYHVKHIDRAAQQQLFEAQLNIAAKVGLPLLLHVRKAHDQVLATLRRKNFSHGGIVHAFSGSLQQAQQFIMLGFKIGIGGTVTYQRARKIRRVAETLPLNSLVLETDAPDIPPADHRGERNSPEYLLEVLDSLSEIRTEEKTVIASQTTANARCILSLNSRPQGE